MIEQFLSNGMWQTKNEKVHTPQNNPHFTPGIKCIFQVEKKKNKKKFIYIHIITVIVGLEQ